MRSASHLRWLHDELPDLVRRGVLDPEAAERLRDHYGEVDRSVSRRMAVGIFGVLGAILVGGGVILVLAHNWDQLSRPLRAALSVAPLAACVALAAWVAASGRGATWREAVGALWALAIGSSISLVAQTYNIPGDWTTFLLAWLLLGAPVLYLLGSVTVGLLYALGALTWVWSATWGPGDPTWFLPLLGVALPFVGWRMAREPGAPGTELLAWVYALALTGGLGPSLDRLGALLWGPLLATVFVGVGAGGALGGERRWGHPLRVVGGLGAAGTGLVLSFTAAWEGPARAEMPLTIEAGVESAIVVIAVAAALWCALAWQRRDRIDGATACLGVLVAWLALLVARLASPEAAAVLVNLSLLGLGAALLVRGMRDGSLVRANLGTGLLGLLTMVRFFDTDWSFLVRGAAFIAIGVGFLLVNVALARRRETT